MPTLLIHHARLLVTQDDARREIEDGAVFIRDQVIEAVGPSAELPASADEVLDARGLIVLPGLVNTHHHMYQTLTRARAQDCELFDWLRTLYPIWGRMTPEMIRVSTQTAMAELLLSGCTTSSDHLYLYPNGATLEDSLEAAEQIGMRFHAARGAMSVGESAGGLPPDALVESEAAILKDTQRLIERWHDPARHAMRRIVVAPCSPFSVSPALMRESARLARSFGAGHGVSLHTHLAENDKDIAYSRERFGMTPAEYAESLGWTGRDVWHAHCVKLDAPGIGLFARTGTGVAHCPCSNMRLASGIAPIRAMRAAGVPVGLGVDGSASNDGSHLLAEARMALLLQRVAHGPVEGPAALGVRGALDLATRGGAAVLGRDDLGAIAPGMSADLAIFALDDVAQAGAQHDPLAALLLCQPPRTRHTVVNGRFVVRDGELQTLSLPRLVETHNRLARQLDAG
ncbi:8-oxoguanine deaminase [Aquariibacter albus]|uniref:8-oxoguanine deaminase n=1 Tax=Aquariibacter albus TaxID=2759899 RepID=A0A839HQK3_9BURK|nr:8-oxoguanine deaminase [Aquariibacter albus]MBB1161321.1 8-oxoguanine deaminase [Aquariibacter albus]